MSSCSPTRVNLRRFLSSIELSGFILDLGCGPSPFRNFAQRRIGLDIDGRPGVDVRADAHALPFQDGTFDIVLCTEVLEHLFEPWRAIGEIERVLRPGGRCILTTRFCYPIHDAPRDFYRFTEFALRRLFGEWQLSYLEPDTDVISSMMVALHYGSKERVSRPLARLFRQILWTPCWKVYFRIFPWFRIQASEVAPTGYNLIAQKKNHATSHI